MNTTDYVLRPKSHGSIGHLVGLDFTVKRNGIPLGGNNIQVVMGAPEQKRYELDQDVALWLASGWWVTFRNQFERAPEIAATIVESVAEELAAVTARASAQQIEWAEVKKMLFRAHGPDYWR